MPPYSVLLYMCSTSDRCEIGWMALTICLAPQVSEELTLRGAFNVSIALCSDLQYLDTTGTRCTSCRPEGELVRDTNQLLYKPRHHHVSLLLVHVITTIHSDWYMSTPRFTQIGPCLRHNSLRLVHVFATIHSAWSMSSPQFTLSNWSVSSPRFTLIGPCHHHDSL